MNSQTSKVYLFIHVICCVKNKEPLLTKPVRTVLFAHIKKNAADNGINVLLVNGTEDHMHVVVQMMPTQNLAQIMKSIRTESAAWINESKFIKNLFEWEEGFAALSVSPSSVKQVLDYIEKQEEHHKTKSLDSELEVFQKIQI
ncbi:IS200/IS605 family transposase [Niastella caeni]|uniref:IS200/IS605 family transposase n=1 Tax=Niastella caeni TaxID=2569763 RepID=A0A4S8I2A0_9BACT|nr:IS200/IS605 family transposase [Niastella caeni]THU39952.1 IS200/IS605 family transposase [Niastella caeni]